MQVYRLETTISQDSGLQLMQLPFRPGEEVEVIVLSRSAPQVKTRPEALIESAVELERPIESAAENDREEADTLIDRLLANPIRLPGFRPLSRREIHVR